LKAWKLLWDFGKWQTKDDEILAFEHISAETLAVVGTMWRSDDSLKFKRKCREASSFTSRSLPGCAHRPDLAWKTRKSFSVGTLLGGFE